MSAAEWPRDLAAAAGLLRAYFASLAADPAVPAKVRAIDREPELNQIEARYTGGLATLLLAWAGEQAVGCAAVHCLSDPAGAAEMKRLYVAPSARGCGAGRLLVLACAEAARALGANALLLDTLPAAMPGAVCLYQSLGFEQTSPYNENLQPEFAFFRMGLSD